MQVIYPRCHRWSQRTLARFSTLPCGGLLSGNDFGRCIGLSCLKKWDKDDKVGRCRPSCLEQHCTNLDALRLFACPCVVLMSRSLLRGTAVGSSNKNCQPFRRLAHLSKATIRRKTRWEKVEFTDLMDGECQCRGWRSCRERVVEFSATSPRWLLIACRFCTSMLSGDAMNVYVLMVTFFCEKNTKYFQYCISTICSTWQTLSLNLWSTESMNVDTANGGGWSDAIMCLWSTDCIVLHKEIDKLIYIHIYIYIID